MATTNHTLHYNLPQWATGDKVGILANLNPAFDTIDTNLFKAVTNSEAAVNTANSASQVATSVNQAVTELSPDVVKNGADILSLQLLVNTLSTKLNAIDSYNNVTISPSTALNATTSGTVCKERGDKKTLNIAFRWTIQSRTLKIESGVTVIGNIGIRPKNERVISNGIIIRYVDNSNSDKIVINPTTLRIRTNGDMTILSNLDLSTTSDCYFTSQLSLVTDDWYN